MEIKHKLNLPRYRGDVVKERLKVLEPKVKYQGYTLEEDLSIVKTDCRIENNGSYNYHNNYDDSEDVLKVGFDTSKWWTMSYSEIKKIQIEHIDLSLSLLHKEIQRLEHIKEEKYNNARQL